MLAVNHAFVGGCHDLGQHIRTSLRLRVFWQQLRPRTPGYGFRDRIKLLQTQP